MKRKALIVFATMLTMTLLFGCSAPEEINQTASSVQTAHDISSSEQASVTSNLPQSDGSFSDTASSEHEGYEALENYMQLLVKSVNVPISSLDDYKQLDLFNFLVYEAEEYAKKQGKTYAAKDAYESAYWFPENDLLDLSVKLFGFTPDLGPYKEGTYFEKHGYATNYFDRKRGEFFIVIVDVPEPAAKTADVSIKELFAYKSDAAEVSVSCVLNFAQDLGDSGTDKNGTYRFEITQDNDLTYYLLKSVEL